MSVRFQAIIKSFSMIVLFLVFSGCLEDRPSQRQASYNPNESWFSGAITAINQGGFPISIKIEWNPHTDAIGYKIYTVDKGNLNSGTAWTLVATINDSTASQYIHSSDQLTPGEIYTYKVKAIDSKGEEDSNEIQKSTIAFEGINGVNIIDQTSAEILVGSQGSFSEIQVVAHPKRLPTSDTSLDVAQVYPAASDSIKLEGLLPGTTYSFKAQVTINSQGDVDGNNISINKKTFSKSYGSGNRQDDLGSFGFRNVRLVQGYGDAPNELNTSTLATAPPTLTPFKTPHQPVIRIIPNPFKGQFQGKFRVLRTIAAGALGVEPPTSFDLTNTKVCTPTENTPCVVCDHQSASNPNVDAGDCDLNIGNIPPAFIDKSLAAPPQKYFYTVTYVHPLENGSLWPEELPETHLNDFTFAAHVPDPYMVLVHRESVNYEVCALMNKASNPRRHNRCSYKGIGGFPRAGTGEPLDSLFDDAELCVNPSDPATCQGKLDVYDFGYNLLADRHALSCKWSRPNNLGNHHCSGSTGFEKGCAALAVETPTGSESNRPLIEVQKGVAPNAASLPDLNFQFNDTYAQNPATLLNLQGSGNNCYVNIGNENLDGNNEEWIAVGRLAEIGLNMSSATPDLKARIKKAVSNATTADPGPLGTEYTDRKRPALTGLTNTEATAACNAQKTSYGSGNKRLMRRREYIASTPLPSLPGEPGFTTISERNAISTGSIGNTFYNHGPQTEKYGGGSIATLGTNPGGCARPGNQGGVFTVPQRCLVAPCTKDYNNTFPKWTAEYCNNPDGCVLNEEQRIGGFYSSFLDLDGQSHPFSNVLDYYLDEKSETSFLNPPFVGGAQPNSHKFFIGSLATNKCVSRFGMQDPYVTPVGYFNESSKGQTGLIFSDKFEQTTPANQLLSNSPNYVPVSNEQDPGVFFDYTYVRSGNNNAIEFRNDAQGYTGTPVNGYENITCTNALTNTSQNLLTDSFFYLTSKDTRGNPDIGVCDSNANGELHTLKLKPQRNYNVFPGYLPFMGLPLLQNATSINPNQELIPFADFLFGNRFGSSHANLNTIAKFYATKPGFVNMASGTGSRWSYDLSESSDINNAGMAWCVVEVQ